MGGAGSRFANTGLYNTIKPLIEVTCPITFNKKPMIQMAIESLGLTGNYIFIVSKEHNEKYDLENLLTSMVKPNKCIVILEDGPLLGAANACLLAENYINNNNELIVTNCDQYIDWSPGHFFHFVHKHNADGALITCQVSGDRWSFCQVEDSGSVSKVVEKHKISDIVNTGIYYWKTGLSFINSTKEMINNKENFYKEFYIAPTFNKLISQNKKILNYPISNISFTGTGTPDDLNRYENIMNERKLNV